MLDPVEKLHLATARHGRTKCKPRTDNELRMDKQQDKDGRRASHGRTKNDPRTDNKRTMNLQTASHRRTKSEPRADREGGQTAIQGQTTGQGGTKNEPKTDKAHQMDKEQTKDGQRAHYGRTTDKKSNAEVGQARKAR